MVECNKLDYFSFDKELSYELLTDSSTLAGLSLVFDWTYGRNDSLFDDVAGILNEMSLECFADKFLIK